MPLTSPRPSVLRIQRLADLGLVELRGPRAWTISNRVSRVLNRDFLPVTDWRKDRAIARGRVVETPSQFRTIAF